MARAAAIASGLLGLLTWGGACTNNPYVIGRVDDAGAAAADADAGAATPDADDECATGAAAALLCSGFEALDLESEWEASVSSGAAAVERSAARSHHGTGALHAISDGPESYGLVLGRFPAQRSGDVHLRAHVYMPSGLATEIMNILFVGSAERSDPFEGIDINVQNGALQLFSPQSAMRYSDRTALPRDRWFCLQLHIAIDAQDGFVRAFVDERLALETEPFDTLPSAGLGELRAGVDWSSNQAEHFEIFFDDLVLDTSAVACRE